MPLALLWRSTTDQELLKTIHGEPSEISATEKQANEIAVRKAEKWIDGLEWPPQ
jgi:hypothetical protein